MWRLHGALGRQAHSLVCDAGFGSCREAEKAVTTIEGVSGATSLAVQIAWEKLDVAQCGYCQSGQIMSAIALLNEKRNPTDAEIDAAMSGTIESPQRNTSPY